VLLVLLANVADGDRVEEFLHRKKKSKRNIFVRFISSVAELLTFLKELKESQESSNILDECREHWLRKRACLHVELYSLDARLDCVPDFLLEFVPELFTFQFTHKSD